MGKGGRVLQFTSENVFKELQHIQEARGKKVFAKPWHSFLLLTSVIQNTDRSEQIRILEKLLEVTATKYQQIRVLLGLVSARFDYNASVTSHMPIELWVAAQKEVDQLIDILATDSQYSVEEVTPEYDELAERAPDHEPDKIVRIRGSIISFVDRLDDEFTKSLQNIDPHGTEYVGRLKYEKYLYTTITRAQSYYGNSKIHGDSLTRVIMRRLEHIYSKVCGSNTLLNEIGSSYTFHSPTLS